MQLDNFQCVLNSFDNVDGWADLIYTIQKYPEHAIVISAAARTKTSTASYGDIMSEALQEMERELTVSWITNRHGDSVGLLHSFQQGLSGDTIQVI